MSRIQDRDEKLVKNNKRYLIIRNIFSFISIILFVGIVSGIMFYDGPREIGKDLEFALNGLFLTIFIAYAAHIRIQHIESIKFYKHRDEKTNDNKYVR